ncbi:MAG: ABC transporter permease [Verrucomicrobia bacterium]|nr:MAG: ABC transporter permease [Verrucomicrobiota bacterium]
MSVFRGFRAILYKEFLVVLRDPFTLFLMLFPPVLEMVAFGYALETDVRRMRTALLDEDRTVESRRIVERFVNTDTFRIVERVGSAEELAAAVRKGRVYVGIDIPPGFARDLEAGRTARLQVLVDGSNSSVAGSALNTAVALALRESMERLASAAGVRELPFEVRPQILFNPAMRSPNFFVPGVIGVVLQIATTFATAMSLVRERERGTLEQLFVSPLRRWGLLLGKLVPYLLISGVMAFALFAIMSGLFDVPIAGSPWVLALATLLYLFALLVLGLLISTRAQNQMQALQFSMVFVMPSVFFSGFIFPRDTMPVVFRAIGACLPTTYFIETARGVVLRGATLADVAPHLGVLAGMGGILFVLCALRFRWKLG